jgi:predicted carbohydrate-binding protein with CBM5 and CBM33 domain
LNLSAAVFQKSSHSGPNGCVEVAFIDGNVAVRDSKHKDGAVLVFTSRAWEEFLVGVTDGQFQFQVSTPLD